MAEAHPNARLEAFSDAVFAIALTLLIIDIRIPAGESINSTTDLWRALELLTPAVFAFLLSFGNIYITWVNHHGAMKLIQKSSGSFIYANGFLLLTVVFLPFPTSLLGEYLRTDHVAPAVILYNAVLALQAGSWALLGGTALRNDLTDDDEAAQAVRVNSRNAYWAFALYTLLAIVAFWFPLTAAAITTASWIYWLVLGIRLRHA